MDRKKRNRLETLIEAERRAGFLEIATSGHYRQVSTTDEPVNDESVQPISSASLRIA